MSMSTTGGLSVMKNVEVTEAKNGRYYWRYVKRDANGEIERTHFNGAGAWDTYAEAISAAADALLDIRMSSLEGGLLRRLSFMLSGK